MTSTLPSTQLSAKNENENEKQRAQDIHYLSQALDLARLSPPKPTNFRVGCVIVAVPSPSFCPPVPNPPSSSSGENSGLARSGQTRILATGYTLELAGNTHAEQNALAKLAAHHHLPESRVHECPEFLDPAISVTLYTSLEPCAKRLSGNKPCVERILATRGPGSSDSQGGTEGDTGGGGGPQNTRQAGLGSGSESISGPGFGVRRIVYGAREPDTFVQKSAATQTLEQAGVQIDYVGDLEAEILRVAMEGHDENNAATVAATEKDNTQTQAQAQAQPRAGQHNTHTGTNIDDISPEERRRQEALPRNPKKRMMEVNIPPQH